MGWGGGGGGGGGVVWCVCVCVCVCGGGGGGGGGYICSSNARLLIPRSIRIWSFFFLKARMHCHQISDCTT